MKKYVLSAIVPVFAVLISIQTANAQWVEKIKVEIPFEFSVGGKTFEAGKYVLAAVNSFSKPNIFRLIDSKNNSRMMFIAHFTDSGSGSGKGGILLKFRRYGDQYFLAEISDPAMSFSNEVRKSKQELLTAKKFAKKAAEIIFADK